MMFAVSSLAAVAALLLLAVVGSTSATTTTSANKPMLRSASVAQALAQSTVYGSIDTQVVLQNATHPITFHERRVVSACFISSYNDYFSTSGYQINGFRIKMTHFSNTTDSSNSNSTNTTTLDASKKTATKWPYNLLTSGTGFACNLCGPSLLDATTTPQLSTTTSLVPPLNDGFISMYHDCLNVVGYMDTMQQVTVNFFAPTVMSYMDEVMTKDDAASVVAAAAVNPATTTTTAMLQKPSSRLTSNTLAESDLFLYGLSTELSSAELDQVADCYSNSYNELFVTSDWSVEFFHVAWQTVIGVDRSSSSKLFSTTASNNLQAGYTYLLMDASIELACTECIDDDKPDANAAAINNLQSSVYICLIQAKSSHGVFDGLESVEIRNMVSASSSTAVHQTTKKTLAASTQV